jgi:hypothetical protein
MRFLFFYSLPFRILFLVAIASMNAAEMPLALPQLSSTPSATVTHLAQPAHPHYSVPVPIHWD